MPQKRRSGKSRILPGIVIIVPLSVCISVLIYSLHSSDLLQEIDKFECSGYTAEPECALCSHVSESRLTDSGLYFSAKLGTQAEQPIAGVTLTPRRQFSMDFSSYQFITIELDSGSTSFNLTLTQFEKGFSDSANGDTHRYFQLEHTLDSEKTRVRVPLRSLPTPVFWYVMNNTNRERFGKPDFSRVTALIFSNHPSTGKGETVSFTIRKITLGRSMIPFWTVLSLSLLFWLIASMLFVIRSRTIKIILPDELAPADHTEEKLFAEIQNSLGDSGLTIEKLAEITGIPKRKIREVILAKTGSSYQLFLRESRLAESCRLLTQTDLEIKEIAFQTGFSHSSSFTRAFRERYSISPTEFRSGSRTKKV